MLDRSCLQPLYEKEMASPSLYGWIWNHYRSGISHWSSGQCGRKTQRVGLLFHASERDGADLSAFFHCLVFPYFTSYVVLQSISPP